MKHFVRDCLLCLVTVCSVSFGAQLVKADEVAKNMDVHYETSQGNSFSNGTDDSYDSVGVLSAGEELTISAPEEIQGIYIKWNRIPKSWQLVVGNETLDCGTEGFLHEYVEVPSGTTSLVIKADHEVTVCDIDVYGKGELPSDVQKWEKPCEKADILVFATHADDEILFLGGVLANYGAKENLAVQVSYMCEFYSTLDKREHEKLDGIWHCGVKSYPVCGDFEDLYSRSLDKAMEVYDYNAVLSYATKMIRRFQPLVVVSQDMNGEYGHGGHMIHAKAVTEAVDNSMKADFCKESADEYGVYDVPKAYFHLYEENPILLDVNETFSFGGKTTTAFELATESYQYHKSQLWCAFYVSDGEKPEDTNPKYTGSKYSIRKFGLYRSTVGADVNCNDFMENLKSYEQIAKEEEQKRLEEEQKKEQELLQSQQETDKAVENAKNTKNPVKLILVLVAAIILVLVLLVIVRYIQVQQRRKKRRNKNKRH